MGERPQMPPRMSQSVKLASKLVSTCLQGRREWCLGFTLVELTLVLVVLVALSGLAIPFYIGYLEKARVARAIAEIHMFSKALDLFELDVGELPDTLADAGLGNPIDPWGNPYEYLNIASSAKGGGKKAWHFSPPGAAYAAQGGGQDDGLGLWSLFSPSVAYAGGGGGTPQPRKDRFLVPVNSDYDLYSKGEDGESVAPFTAPKSRDDIVRANDGAFVGFAADF